jgi:lipid A 4'-phosphatase
MQYLRLRRSQIILACFVSFALFITAFPAVDISISKIFFDGNSFLRDQWWQKLLQDGLGYFLCVSVLAVIGIYACNRLLKRNVCGVDGRRVVFVILVLVIGAGLIVNVILKDNFGRARPREISEFGGSRQFTPPFVVSGQCNTNCSFSSGDAAGGFFSLALALALGRRRAMFLAGLALGALVSVSRISSGAHFFSDTVVSFFVMLIVADVLFFYLVLMDVDRGEAGVRGNLLRPVYLTVRTDAVTSSAAKH